MIKKPNETIDFDDIARGSRELLCSITTRTFPPESNEESKTAIVGASITIPDYSYNMTRNLYEIKPHIKVPLWYKQFRSTAWEITLFTVVKETPISHNRVNIEYSKKQIVHRGIKKIEDFIDDLILKYKTGRIFVNYDWSKNKLTWGLSPGVVGRDIYYKQAKSILRFEHKARTELKVVEDARPAIILSDPRLIPGRIDFGNYVLESWGSPSSKRRYSYSAFDRNTERWVEKLCKQVTI